MYYLKGNNQPPVFLEIDLTPGQRVMKTHRGHRYALLDEGHRAYLTELHFGGAEPCSEREFQETKYDFLEEELSETETRIGEIGGKEAEFSDSVAKAGLAWSIEASKRGEEVF